MLKRQSPSSTHSTLPFLRGIFKSKKKASLEKANNLIILFEHLHTLEFRFGEFVSDSKNA